MKILSPRPTLQASFVHNPTYIYPQGYILDTDRYHFLTGDAPAYVVHSTALASDWSAVMSAGPFNLAPGGSVQVWFALLGGSSLADLKVNADVAQALWNGHWGATTGVPENETAGSPARVALRASPNPFRRATGLQFDVAQTGAVRLRIFDVEGRQVTTLVNGIMESGRHNVLWDGRDQSGRVLASGIYYARLETDAEAVARKILLLR
jgi:hypothetical protein